MNSPAAEIARICGEGLDALESGRLEVPEDLAARIEAVGRSTGVGSADEIRAALRATRALEEAVAAASRETALELSRVWNGKRALRGYNADPGKKPRAVDLSA